MAKTQQRKRAAPARRPSEQDSAEWQRRELKRKLRVEREIVRLVSQVERAHVRSDERLRQFAIDYLAYRGFIVSPKNRAEVRHDVDAVGQL